MSLGNTCNVKLHFVTGREWIMGHQGQVSGDSKKQLVLMFGPLCGKMYRNTALPRIDFVSVRIG